MRLAQCADRAMAVCKTARGCLVPAALACINENNACVFAEHKKGPGRLSAPGTSRQFQFPE
jgi:hypothetical protein